MLVSVNDLCTGVWPIGAHASARARTHARTHTHTRTQGGRWERRQQNLVNRKSPYSGRPCGLPRSLGGAFTDAVKPRWSPETSGIATGEPQTPNTISSFIPVSIDDFCTGVWPTGFHASAHARTHARTHTHTHTRAHACGHMPACTCIAAHARQICVRLLCSLPLRFATMQPRLSGTNE